MLSCYPIIILILFSKFTKANKFILFFRCLGDRLAESGALQLTIANISVDHYPYHKFRSSKKTLGKI